MPSLSPSSLSVIDPRRPELNRSYGNERASYTFLQRVPKVQFTLGWELEANHCAARVPAGIERISDGSVNGDSAEYVVMPTVVKSARYVLGLLKDLVHSPKLNTDNSCGFHVHFAPKGVKTAKMRQWAIACEWLAMQIEDDAFKAVPNARQDNQYCRRISPLRSGMRFVAGKYGNNNRYHWVNIVEMFRPHGIRTVEVRLLGNTHRWKYLSAWSLFCLQLGHEAWRLVHTPYDTAPSINRLRDLLKKIQTDIKPLDKKHEPAPDWIYAGLNALGIETAKWDRPLTKLRDAEHELNGTPKVFYSDNQMTIPNGRNVDDDGDYCACGCGEESRCYYQIHSDGDCDNNDCETCHEEGNCDGEDDCLLHAREARRERERRARPVTAVNVRAGVDAIRRNDGEAVASLGMQTELDAIANAQIDNAQMFGMSITSIALDESANMTVNPVTAAQLFSTVPLAGVSNPSAWVMQEGIELPITASELLASEARERRYSAERYTPRALTVAEIETMNRNNENRLRGQR